MFEGFPYTNFHELNLDWIIKIAKDFLDQYTHIQEVIETGEQSLLDKTDAGLAQLQEKADALEQSLTGLYNGYSDDLAEQLRNALADLNTWYTQHQGYLNDILATNIAAFQTAATTAGQGVLDSIPTEYGNITNIVKAIPYTMQDIPGSAWPFFEGYGYYNASMVWTENSGLATLKIPIDPNGFVVVSSAIDDFMSGISGNYRFMFELQNGSYSRTKVSSNTYGTYHTDGNFEAIALGYTDVKYIHIAINATKVGQVYVIKDNSLYARSDAVNYPKGIYKLTKKTAATCQMYFNESQIAMLTTSHAVWKSVLLGDIIDSVSLVTGISYYGSYISSDNTIRQRINSIPFTVPKDGIVCIFELPDTLQTARYIPVNRFQLYASDIIGGENENSYYGLNGVAFGTSLTYRSQSTGGYLNYLPTLSSMSWDNQGVGSGTIKKVGASNGLILDAIKNYTGYANKRVALIEGFVNDWGYNPDTLGNYTDTSEATVCGCVRVAINHILAQNPNITVFLVLDHYGRNYNGTDNSSSSKNSSNLTQYQYWNEIAKVAESLGVPVIPLYKISGISENTPQYLMDNIHPTTLGAMQTAYAIWECMKQYFPNQVTT